MKRALAAFLFSVAASATPAAAPQTPRIDSVPGEVGHIELGPDVTAALKAFDPQFKIYEAKDFIASVREMFSSDSENETPMAVVGDFNGDKKSDVALMGASGANQLILAVVSQKNGYKVFEIARARSTPPDQTFYPPPVDDDEEYDENESSVPRQQGLYEYLGLVKPKASAGKGEGAVKRFDHDAIQLEIFRGDTRLIYFKDGKFALWKDR